MDNDLHGRRSPYVPRTASLSPPHHLTEKRATDKDLAKDQACGLTVNGAIAFMIACRSYFVSFGFKTEVGALLMPMLSVGALALP